MADFLTRVSQRVFGQAAVARPIIAPLFSPPTTGEATPKASSALSMSLPDSEEEALEAPAEPMREGPAVPSSSTLFQTHPIAPVSPVSARLLAPSQPQTISDHAQPLVQSFARLAEVEHSAAPTMERTFDSTVLEQEADVPLVPLTSRRHTVGPGVERVHTLQPAVFEPPQEAPSQLAILSTETWPSPEPSTGLQSSALPEPPAPVIHVTIGRIEVRAVMPQQRQPARPAPQQPAASLSLEAFLKQRNGGAR
jgi:hypothetical protein